MDQKMVLVTMEGNEQNLPLELKSNTQIKNFLFWLNPTHQNSITTTDQ
jgi:hypothetical protein